jgi:hypothetical protein
MQMRVMQQILTPRGRYRETAMAVLGTEPPPKIFESGRSTWWNLSFLSYCLVMTASESTADPLGFGSNGRSVVEADLESNCTPQPHGIVRCTTGYQPQVPDSRNDEQSQHLVVPAKAGTQGYGAHHRAFWMPAFAGMTALLH